MRQYNFYCDESSHLENDDMPMMLIGGIWCPTEEVRHISEEIRNITLQSVKKLPVILIRREAFLLLHIFHKALQAFTIG